MIKISWIRVSFIFCHSGISSWILCTLVRWNYLSVELVRRLQEEGGVAEGKTFRALQVNGILCSLYG